jgi:uncharacterized iron-regulated membrane protein
MRNLHRWISTVCMLFLAWVSITGTLLALDELFPPSGLDAPRPAAVPGAPRRPPPPPDAYTAMRLRQHNLLKQLHTGAIIGLSGESLSLITGAVFFTLAVSGIVMYFDMLGRRRRIGRKDLFWS